MEIISIAFFLGVIGIAHFTAKELGKTMDEFSVNVNDFDSFKHR